MRLATVVIGAVMVLAVALPASAGVLHVRIQTDKELYNSDELVTYTVYARVEDGDLSLVSVSVRDVTDEAISVATSLGDAFSSDNGFAYSRLGTVSPAGTMLVDIFAMQVAPSDTPSLASDGAEHILVTGTYTATIGGQHVLRVVDTRANFWPGEGEESVMSFSASGASGSAFDTFDVIVPEPATIGLLSVAGVALLRRRRG